MVRHKNDMDNSPYYRKVRAENRSIPDNLLKTLVKQKYHVVGEHSAAKICHWASSALTCGECCYKSKFYGIDSHRCLQCTPVLLFCNHACVFCWRLMPEKSVKFDEMPCGEFQWDEPERIVQGLIDAQKEIMSGFGGNPKADKNKCAEAQSPLHAAISLTGEPTMYPHLERLIMEFTRRKMTTFLVTNGTFPERIAKFETMPTQFYVSMVAPNEGVYKSAIRPKTAGLWKKYQRMLEMMPAIGKKTRTVLRMTLARGVNDSDLEGYARQIGIANPHYVEVKSMVYVGGARQEGRKLGLDSMLSVREIKQVAKRLADLTGYLFSEVHEPSRVALLCRDDAAEKNRKIIGLA